MNAAFLRFLLVLILLRMICNGYSQDTTYARKGDTLFIFIDLTKSGPPKKHYITPKKIKEPEKTYDLSKWDPEKLRLANTATEADYLTEQEKKIYFYLNLMRQEPQLFSETFLQDLFNKKDYTNTSLLSKLRRMKPLPLLYPDSVLYELALCHARESGRTGNVGHTRTGCKDGYWAECCQYGYDDAIDIVLALLIDRGVPSFGHRNILTSRYKLMGVSIQPHKKFKFNSVLDFGPLERPEKEVKK
jgi:uncharacterized protein YkwD